MNDELLIKFLLKETSEEENATVIRWLHETPENAEHFAQFEKIWKASELRTEEVDEEQAWLTFKAKTKALPTTRSTVKPLKTTYTWIGIAAVLLLAIGSWSIYNLLGPSAYTELASNHKIITEILPDGSELTINKNSQVSYAGDFKQNRSVRLTEGDVFFKVVPDKSKPFVIEINKVEVEVVGTSFNIKHIKNKTEIIVETGIVKVRLGNEEVKLIRGERISVDAMTKRLVKVLNEDQLYTYYRSKLFVANGTPLYKLVAVLNEAYGSNVRVDDTAKDQIIYVTLPFESLAANLQIIAETMKLRITRNQQEILLSYQ